jgi:hypothetical protein
LSPPAKAGGNSKAKGKSRSKGDFKIGMNIKINRIGL